MKKNLFLFFVAVVLSSCEKTPLEVEVITPEFSITVVDSNNNPISDVGLHYIFYIGQNITFRNHSFTYILNEIDSVSIRISDSFNNEIAVQNKWCHLPGKYSFNFDAGNLTNGIYYCTISGSTINEKIKFFVLTDQINLLQELVPFKKTDINGNIRFPISIFGIGEHFPHLIGEHQEDLVIADSVKIILRKQGYRTLTKTITLNPKNSFESTFYLVDTGNEVLMPVDTVKIKNIQWNLVSLETQQNIYYLNNYKPFMLMFRNENRFWAYDDCNYLTGYYIINYDTLDHTPFWETMAGCIDRVFPFDFLRGNPIIMMRGEKLLLKEGDTTYVFYSDFYNSVPNFNFINDTLMLRATNDTNIHFFDSLGLYPSLVLDDDKQFELKWFNRNPPTTESLNFNRGVFGLNSSKLLFTSLGWRSAYASIAEFTMVGRILDANRFEYNNSVLRIKNDETGTYYDFSR